MPKLSLSWIQQLVGKATYVDSCDLFVSGLNQTIQKYRSWTKVPTKSQLIIFCVVSRCHSIQVTFLPLCGGGNGRWLFSFILDTISAMSILQVRFTALLIEEVRVP